MNRARDFLAGMEEKTTFRACVFAAILVLMAATMFLLNVHTPLQMDDYDYSFSWSTGKPLAGVADVLASQAAHYRLWGGRSVVHTLAQLFLYWGKGVFNIANTAAYMLLVLELYALAKPKGRRFCWTVLLVIHAALFTLVPFFGTVFLWLDGACNYLWGTALPLALFLLVYGGYQAVREVGAHEAAWEAQTQKIETAVQSGADEVKIASVESRSRFTMNIALEKDAESWPNSTLSKWFGIRVYGE